MSEENVEVVQYLAGETLLFPDAGTYQVGREALTAWIAFIDAFEEFAVGVDRIIDAGEQVAALVWLCGRGQSSGADVEATLGRLHASGGKNHSMGDDRPSEGRRSRRPFGVGDVTGERGHRTSLARRH
jgi:hypothetical protein